jgi:acyl carrier protein
MNERRVLERFSEILGDLLGDDSIELSMDTSRGEVPNWDSFNYVNFIVAVETEFGVKFRVADVESFATVGDIVADLRRLESDG